MRRFLHKYANTACKYRYGKIFFVRSARIPLRGGIYLALQGFLMRAECRALRMTAENGERAFGF